LGPGADPADPPRALARDPGPVWLPAPEGPSASRFQPTAAEPLGNPTHPIRPHRSEVTASCRLALGETRIRQSRRTRSRRPRVPNLRPKAGTQRVSPLPTMRPETGTRT